MGGKIINVVMVSVADLASVCTHNISATVFPLEF